MISASKDRTLKVWDLSNGQELLTLRGHTGTVRGLAVAGGVVISASLDRTLKVWDIYRGVCLTSFDLDELLNSCAISADGQMVVVAGWSGRLHFFR